MKRSSQPWSVVTRFAPLVVLLGLSLAGTLIFPQSASAYHKTNRPDIERGLRDNDGGGWIVIYSKELSQDEETKLSAAIATDVLVSKGGATAAWFEEFVRASIKQVMSEAREKAPQIADSLQRELTEEKLLSSIKASFNGSRVELSIAGTTLQVGRATYNRAECTRIRFGKEDCISTPNTYQPYIRFRVATSTSQQNSLIRGNALVNAGGKCLDIHSPDMRNNGGKVQVWDCNGQPQQQWSFRGNSLVNAGGKCLDVHSPDMRNNGGKVQVWDCNGQPQQQWSFRGNSLVNAGGKCLDVHSPDMRNNGGKVQVWDCNGQPQQQWSF